MVGNELVNDYEELASYEQLNLYRNRYYNDGSVTERGIIANAINDILPKYCKQQEEIKRLMSYISDHYWDFCSIAGCEGASNDCWKTCPSSRYNKVKCLNKENRDGCYFGDDDEAGEAETPETINIEKYINALNNLLGSDNAYYAGDPDVDAIMEVIMLAKKLDKRVKELTEEKE